jgi:hypothetical protein
MQLKIEPREPRPGLYYTIERRLDTDVVESWQKFLPGFTPLQTMKGFGFGHAPAYATAPHELPLGSSSSRH